MALAQATKDPFHFIEFTIPSDSLNTVDFKPFRKVFSYKVR
jgi:hypothetical protein